MFCSAEVHSPSSMSQCCYQGVSCTACFFCWCFYLFLQWQGCGYLSWQTARFRVHTNRFWLEAARPAEVEQVWRCSRCWGERRGWCSLLEQRQAVSSRAHLWWESCRVAEMPSLCLSGAQRGGRWGEPNPSGSHCSLFTQPEIKACLARAGTGSGP